jgi:hypothetical protein
MDISFYSLLSFIIVTIIYFAFGKPKLTGSAFYDVENQVYKLKGAGSQIGMNKDEFYFLSSSRDYFSSFYRTFGMVWIEVDSI